MMVVGFVLLVMIILALTGFFGPLTFLPSLFPSQLQQAVTACDQYSTNGLRVDYCDTFREVEIAGKKIWVNCEYGDIKSRLTEKGMVETCGSDKEQNWCKHLNASMGKSFNGDKIMVNNQNCTYWLAQTSETAETSKTAPAP